MIHDVRAIAAEVIRKIHKPADAALREVLKPLCDKKILFHPCFISG